MFGYGANVIVATFVTLTVLCSLAYNKASPADDGGTCDVTSDYVLGQEDYREAILLHQNFLQSHPGNALAHYHLGFAYGMTGRALEEVAEYRVAAELGLHDWDLFLNLGLAYLDQDNLTAATQAFQTALSLGPEHAETHFNLALTYERQNRFPEALREITTARRLAPHDVEIVNTEAVITAQLGNLECSRKSMGAVAADPCHRTLGSR